MSGVALGYPLPTLLNWDGEFNRPEWHFAGSHIAKLESLLSVIEELLENHEDAHDDDLALMIDAHDIWFQLPPSVLIERFHQINREADERNRRLWEEMGASTESGFPISPPRQSIIVTSAKDCHPGSNSGSNPHYDLWPPSPMRADLYGEDTDSLTPALIDSARMFHKIRPRCVNSGMIMGTMGAMRAALRRAKEKVDEVARNGRQLWSDQALFAEVIGDQEAWRLWVREMAATWNGTTATSQSWVANEHIRNLAVEAWRGKQFDFGIGLDYGFETIPPTCAAEDDGYFVKLNDEVDLRIQSEQAGVPGDVRVSGIPPELHSFNRTNDGPIADVQWGDVPLYTDFFFGTTPVGIHHNAYIDNLKPWRLQHWWSRMWFYPMLRELVTYSLRASGEAGRALYKLRNRSPDAITYLSPAGDRVTVYNPGEYKSQATFEEIGWDGVCQKSSSSKPWYDELFGDLQGPLEAL